MNATRGNWKESGARRTALPSGFLRRPAHFLALGLGSGCAPWAPGTCGTLTGVAIYLAAQSLPLAGYVALTAALFALGIYLCGTTAAALGVHDHPAIVWDEIVGYLITMTAAPRGWTWIVAGFLLFRLFDMAKPWPIGWLDRKVSGGVGIMLDDATAGLIAAAVLQLLVKIA